MVLQAQIFFDHRCHDRGNTTQLGMAKRIPQALISQKPAIFVANAFRDHNRAVAETADFLIDQSHKALAVKSHLGEQDNDGYRGFFIAGHAAGCGNPAGMAAHNLKDKYFG